MCYVHNFKVKLMNNTSGIVGVLFQIYLLIELVSGIWILAGALEFKLYQVDIYNVTPTRCIRNKMRKFWEDASRSVLKLQPNVKGKL